MEIASLRSEQLCSFVKCEECSGRVVRPRLLLADHRIHDHEQFSLAGFHFEVHEIPGHSSGHVAFLVWPEEAIDGPPMVFAGDILFRGSIGRTDFPDGSFPTLASGIRERLYPLPEASLVLPGHGEPTTIGRERTSNPYVNATGDGLPGLN